MSKEKIFSFRNIVIVILGLLVILWTSIPTVEDISPPADREAETSYISDGKVPAIDIAYCISHDRHTTPIWELREAIGRLSSGESEKETVTITVSFPRVGSEILRSRFEEDEVIEYYDPVRPLPLDPQRVRFRTMQAFRLYEKVFEYDVPGLDLVFKVLNNDNVYELETRRIDHRSQHPVGVNGVGDINIVTAPIEGTFDALATVEYQTILGQTSNSGMMIILNSDRFWVDETDPHIYQYPSADNNLQPWATPFLSTIAHEIGHTLGLSHFPRVTIDTESDECTVTQFTSNHAIISRIKPSIMRSNITPAQRMYDYMRRDGLMSDVWVRYSLSRLYDYSIEHIVRRSPNDVVNVRRIRYRALGGSECGVLKI